MSRLDFASNGLLASKRGLMLMLLLSLCATDYSHAQGLRLPFSKKVDANPEKDYELTETNGPWMIKAASFIGDEGELQARELVQELRAEFNVPSYLFRQNYDFSGVVEGRAWQLDENNPERVVPKKMRYNQGQVFDEIAVLVGDFASVDDAKGQKMLEKIKMAKPACLAIDGSRTTHQKLGLLREMQRLISNDEELRQRGPMRNAFLIPNPLLPDDFFTRGGPDEFILKLNEGVDNSLLKCPKRYSVRVATYRGEVVLGAVGNVDQPDNEFHLRNLLGKGEESKLAIAADKAHRLTVALRHRKIEAYEFHDRHESYVCVGSFNSLGTERSDGKTEIDRDVLRVIDVYRATQDNIPGLAGVMSPKSLPELTDCPFDLQPVPVEVPRVSAISHITRGQSQR
jgi:hypothetical protein